MAGGESEWQKVDMPRHSADAVATLLVERVLAQREAPPLR